MPRWLLVVALCCIPFVTFADWKPQAAPVMTRWAKDVTPDKVHPEYPRPQMVREHWMNLNGLWDYAILDKKLDRTDYYTGQILVPFPVESALSGVMKPVGPDKRLIYRRKFNIPSDAAWKDKTILLHFGAVDWECTVWVNGKEAGMHRGGFDPFTFDITPHLKAGGENELVVSVYDPSDAGYQPRGKQVEKPHGIWYTPVTGIWQTVWLEPVAKTYISGIVFKSDFETNHHMMEPIISGDAAGLFIKAAYKTQTSREKPFSRFSATVQGPVTGRPIGLIGGQGSHGPGGRLGPFRADLIWSPADPVLFDVIVELEHPNGEQIDRIDTTTAIRKISIGKDKDGIQRILLNNQPLFQYGTLDQGWWPDGLYTAPTDEALKFDIEITKKYGFNMIRKHVKVEPERWYYWADKLGMLVWQDMPSGDKSAQWDPFGRFNGKEFTRSEESAKNYRDEWKHIIDARRNHPSIVMWVPFNEGWGQSDTAAATKWTKEYDPSRLVNCASGGNDFPVGDVIDVHRYPGPTMVEPSGDRAGVLGEFGGLGLPLNGHTWQGEKNWGYRTFTTQEALTDAYLDLMDKLPPLVGKGLSAAIYTQTTDVEIEVNGLLTYDRAVEKIPVDVAAAAHRKLWEPAPKVVTLLPTAETMPAEWRYTIAKPAAGWEQSGFNDDDWNTGNTGFGEPTTPGSKVNTPWKTPDIWLRRTFEVKSKPDGEMRLRIHHDEDAEVYLNGVLIKKVNGYTTDYSSVRLSEEAQRALKIGGNTFAVHCHQTGGGQYIDVGLDVLK